VRGGDSDHGAHGLVVFTRCTVWLLYDRSCYFGLVDEEILGSKGEQTDQMHLYRPSSRMGGASTVQTQSFRRADEHFSPNKILMTPLELLLLGPLE
jgi:hypothetical protein